MIFITDIHGCYYTLRRLLQKLPDDAIALGGDLVDRGPHSAKVLQWARQNQIPTVLGNHEDMMLHSLGEWDGESSPTYDYTWNWNGGDETMLSLNTLTVQERLDVLHWVQALPQMHIFGPVLLSHTGHGLLSNRYRALWSRDRQFPNDGYYRIFGHTPRPYPEITETYACIDTGACFPTPNGYGRMTAFQYPSMQIWQQVYDETPLP